MVTRWFSVLLLLFSFNLRTVAVSHAAEALPPAQPAITVDLSDILNKSVLVAQVKFNAFHTGDVLEVMAVKVFKGKWAPATGGWQEGKGYTVDVKNYDWKKFWDASNPPVNALGEEKVIVLSPSGKLEAIGTIQGNEVNFECHRAEGKCSLTPNTKMGLGSLKGLEKQPK